MEWRVVLGILGGVLLAWAAFVGLLWIVRPRDTRLADLVAVVPDLLRLLREIAGDRSAPLGARAAAIGLVAWIVSPIDLVPEFIPVLGPLDDVVVAVLVLRYLRRRLGADDLRRRWRGTEAGYALLARVL